MTPSSAVNLRFTAAGWKSRRWESSPLSPLIWAISGPCCGLLFQVCDYQWKTPGTSMPGWSGMSMASGAGALLWCTCTRSCTRSRRRRY